MFNGILYKHLTTEVLIGQKSFINFPVRFTVRELFLSLTEPYCTLLQIKHMVDILIENSIFLQVCKN